MKNILNAPFVREMCEATANMYRLGWDERNGGNISYMLDEKEVAEYIDVKSSVALVSGTSAIHLALKAIGIKEGDVRQVTIHEVKRLYVLANKK